MNRLGLSLVGGLVWCLFAAPTRAEEDVEFFETRIRPVLVKHCYECHSAKSKELGGIELIIGFDCILRRLELLNRGQRDDVREILGRAPVAGFSTYGEQYNGVHVSQTLTGVAIGRAA